MTSRVRCVSCRTVFVIPEDHPPGRRVRCPKCGEAQVPARKAPTAAEAVTPTLADAPSASVFVPSSEGRPARRRRWFLAIGFFLVATTAATVAVFWPNLQRWWNPVPPDPVEAVATTYLQALVDGNAEVYERLGTVELPPSIRSFRDVRRDRERDVRIRGSFAPISAFHAEINKSFTYDPEIDRYTPRNPLGPAAETLDTLHAAKDKAEREGIYKKMQSGDPEDIFDAAEGLAKTFSSLAEGVLAPKKIIPTYEQLLEEAKPPLPAEARALALDFAKNRESWDAILKRPFATLKADGPFVLEHAEVNASVFDRLGSLGDPPTTLRLTLTRFQLETLRTGWKVTAARRVNVDEPERPDAPDPKESEKPRPRVSPGDLPAPSAGVN
ncbi:MAG: hypothetical protein AB7I30_07520 [Isosphaeraceae bacterium]